MYTDSTDFVVVVLAKAKYNLNPMLCYLLANLIPVSGFDGILRFWLSPYFLPHFTFIVDEV